MNTTLEFTKLDEKVYLNVKISDEMVAALRTLPKLRRQMVEEQPVGVPFVETMFTVRDGHIWGHPVTYVFDAITSYGRFEFDGWKSEAVHPLDVAEGLI